MTDQIQMKNQIEKIFDAYKFVPLERDAAINDLIEVGEALTLDALGHTMKQEDRSRYEALFIPDMTEDDLKKIYDFIKETCTDAVLLETRNTVYNKLVTDYIAHMNG